jgi:3-oxoacyl-[acyl-carrier protein] reductase
VNATVNIPGKKALVTGAASGIGLATVERLARGGAAVGLNYLGDDTRGPEQVERLQGEGLDVIGAPGNVSVPDEAQRMVEAAVTALGGLDYLVNNAGTAGPATTGPIPAADLGAMTEGVWTSLLSTNLLGAFRCTQAAAEQLKASGGAVCNTASVAGIAGGGSSIGYAASKAALISLTNGLARALAPEARVNAVAPGFVETAWTASWPSQGTAGYLQQTMLRRACRPDDIAAVIVFLCVDAVMVTGQTIAVDGGRL